MHNPKYVAGRKTLKETFCMVKNYLATIEDLVHNVKDSCELMTGEKEKEKETETEKGKCWTKGLDLQDLIELVNYSKILDEYETVFMPQLSNLIEDTKKDLRQTNKSLSSLRDIENYKTWTCEQVLNWIGNLENGLFKCHIDTLRRGFIDDKVTGGDVPRIKNRDLLRYGVKVFSHREKLRHHFKRLHEIATKVKEVKHYE